MSFIENNWNQKDLTYQEFHWFHFLGWKSLRYWFWFLVSSDIQALLPGLAKNVLVCQEVTGLNRKKLIVHQQEFDGWHEHGDNLCRCYIVLILFHQSDYFHLIFFISFNCMVTFINSIVISSVNCLNLTTIWELSKETTHISYRS